jgi:hypothetical protein
MVGDCMTAVRGYDTFRALYAEQMCEEYSYQLSYYHVSTATMIVLWNDATVFANQKTNTVKDLMLL